MECLGLSFGVAEVDIFDMGRVFVAVVVEMVVDHLMLEVGYVVRLIWGCLNGRLHFLWHLNQMVLEGKISNVCGRSFGMMMGEIFSWSSFFFMMVV